MRGGRLAWLFQTVTGVGLLFLVGLHWIAQHYLAAGGLRDHAEVVAYLKQPVFLSLEAAFLVFVTIHALLGLRAILLDLGPGRPLRRAIDVGLLAAGFATIFYGIDLLQYLIRGTP